MRIVQSQRWESICDKCGWCSGLFTLRRDAEEAFTLHTDSSPDCRSVSRPDPYQKIDAAIARYIQPERGPDGAYRLTDQ